MSLTILRGPENAPLEPLKGRMIAILGYGNQGRAHALNLRDSGFHVVIGNRPGTPGSDRAREDDFKPLHIAEAASGADLAILALPDELQAEIYEKDIAPHVRSGTILGFLHGFTIHFGQIMPAEGLGVIMVAPKGPGTTLRQRFVQGLGIPCLLAMHRDSPEGDADAIGLAWAAGLGCARAGIIRTTFATEAETDLFGEQAVLVGGIVELFLAAFETLVEAGYPPELAYLECCHEAKQITDLVYERGIGEMMKAISNTAEFGAYRVGPKLIDDSVRERMGRILSEIRDGSFARALIDDRQLGFPWFERHRERLARHPIDKAGEVIRSLMPRIPDQDLPV